MSELHISKEDMAELRRLANTQAGQQLYRYLRKNNSQELKTAVEKAAAGDLSQAKQIAKALLSSPEAKTLLDQLGRQERG